MRNKIRSIAIRYHHNEISRACIKFFGVKNTEMKRKFSQSSDCDKPITSSGITTA